MPLFLTDSGLRRREGTSVAPPGGHGSLRCSLILCTIGRKQELDRFLRSLFSQTHRDFELIVVDQNTDDRVAAILDRFTGSQRVLHLRAEPGLSHARNVALAHVRGDVVAFPDDDCWYEPSLLDRVCQVLEAHPEWDGVTGMAVDEAGKPSASRWARREGVLTRYNCWWRGVSVTLFVRRDVAECVGGFDETLGVGTQSPYGSSEEIDYMLRALEAGFRIQYLPSIVVGHAHPVRHSDRGASARAYQYGMGVGRVLRKHAFPAWFRLFMVLRPAAGLLQGLLRGSVDTARYYWAGLRGRVAGMRPAL